MSDVYCSTKFHELQVHVQSRLVYNCCKAYPERINLEWLENNPGKLFNTQTMVQDRSEMLSGQRCQSCDWGCYRYEDQGLTSARKDHGDRSMRQAESTLRDLKISLSNDCNLTCAYCSAEWSTSWAREIEKNGVFDIPGYKNEVDHWAKLWSKVKQKDRSHETKFFKLLQREIGLCPTIDRITFLGGEPLLNNGLLDVMTSADGINTTIVSGLGLDKNRLANMIGQMDPNKVTFDVSCESTGRFFEFIRNGLAWKNFCDNLELIRKNGFKVRIIATVSNLSSFDIKNFYDLHEHDDIVFNPVSDRSFMTPNVLDDQSKENILSMKSNSTFLNKVKESVGLPYNDNDRKDLYKFLEKFCRIKKLSLEIFPDSFRKWLVI